MSAGGRERRVEDSLCARPSAQPRAVHFCADGEGVDVRREVVDAAWAVAGATPYTAAAFVGDVHGRLRAAARGRLRDAENLAPVRLDPVLWEISWRRGRARHHRMYHAEPGAAGQSPDLVALRFHAKDIEGDAGRVRAVQDAEIAVARERYAAGTAGRWGHGDACRHCLPA